MTQKGLVATIIGGAIVAGICAKNKEFLKLKAENQEMLDKVHFFSDLDMIDREFGKALANAGTGLSALEKEQLRHKVIVEYFNNDQWKANGVFVTTTVGA